MSKKNDCWGIEVGANAIKAIRLVAEGEKIKLSEFDIIPFKEVLSTPDLNVAEAVQMGLDQFLARHDVRHSKLVVSVPGHMAFARFAKLPPVEPKKIPDIVKFEAVQQIPFPIEQVEWDYQVFMQEDSPDVEVGIFAITKERASTFLGNFRTMGMNVDGMTLSPLAVYNAMAYDMGLTIDSPGAIIMDIGTTSTDVIIVEQGRIWLRTLPIGGNNFTDALVRAFKLSFPKAEKLKREAGTSKYARQIFQAMRPVFADLVQEVQRSLGYYQSMNREANLERLIGLGSTFRLPGLQKFLTQQLQMEVTRPTTADGKESGFRRIAAEGTQAAEFSEGSINLATAYGLALQGLDMAEVSANILPSAILRQRLWRAKQPWIAAGAALIVAGVAMPSLKLGLEKTAYERPFEDNTIIANNVISQAREYVQGWKGIESADPRQQIENIRDVLLYREMWPEIMGDLGAAIQSLNSQPELFANDVDKIKAIPRDQRRRLYISRYSATYIPETKVPAGKWTGVPASLQSGMPQPGEPRSFLVRLEGFTPFVQGGPSMVTDTFLGYLRSIGDKNGREYRIITGDEVTMRKRMAVEATTSGRPGRPARPSFGGASDAGRTGAETDVASLLPKRPLADEPRDGDWEFEVKWVIQVLTPNEAREIAKPAPTAKQPAGPAAQLPANPNANTVENRS